MKSVLRVMQVASGDLWAGAEVQLYTLCIYLQKDDDIELLVVLLNEGELAARLRSCGIRVEVIDEQQTGFFKIAQKLLGVVRSFKPDVIHSHRLKENMLAGICSIITGTPSVRSVHGDSEHGYPRFSVKAVIVWLDVILGAYVQKRVVSVSEDLKLKLARKFSANHIDVIQNGIDVDSVESIAAIALEYGKTRIGIVGRLTPVKRIDLFIEMAKQILDSGNDDEIAFYIIGDGPLRSQLEQQAKQFQQNILFLGHVESAVSYLKSLDYIVMCSDHEGTPMTLLEAMCCKVPIIAHDVGGLRELLNEGECGTLVQDHSAGGYAKALLENLVEPDNVRASVSRGYERVLKTYSAGSNANMFKNLYRAIANGD